MKISGKELAEFMQTGWPHDDFFWDHEEFTGDPLADAIYDTGMLGDLYWQGTSGEDPTRGEGHKLDTLIRNWRKSRSSRLVTIRVPNEVTDPQIREALKSLKGSIET